MKARHKDTGEIIELAEEGIISRDGRRFCWYHVELIPEPIDDWGWVLNREDSNMNTKEVLNKLIAEIERLQKRAEHYEEISLTDGERSYWSGENGALELLATFITSLQQEQPIGEEYAIEIGKEVHTLRVGSRSDINRLIDQDKQEQPEVDLEKELDKPTIVRRLQGWVARDEKGTLFYSVNYPKRCSDYWCAVSGDYGFIDKTLFPELKWEDEPIEVELTIQPRT